jgi:hypothetical protein
MKIAPLLAAAVVGMATVAGPVVLVRSQSLEAQVPVRLFLDQPRYAPGAEGHVRVQIGKDGYLLVLYAQPDGHVNVAYPLDPVLSDRVDADTEVEVLTRGGTSAFTVDDSSGSGTWYAAISSKPFQLKSITVNGHWDYRVIPRIESTANTESELTSFVEGISGGRFDYDIVSFVIDTTAPRASSAVPGGPPPAVSGPPPAPPGLWWPAPQGVPRPWVPGPWGWGLWGWGWGGTGPWAGPYYDRTTAGAAGTIIYAPSNSGPAGAAAPPPETRSSGGDEHPAKAPHEGHPSEGGSHSSGDEHGSHQ